MKLTDSIKKSCDALPQALIRIWSKQMTIKVTERDDSRMFHQLVAHGVHLWDVHQEDILVGMFHRESDAHNYKAELERLEAQKRQA